MPVTIHCPHCRQEMSPPDHSPGSPFPCPKCGKSIRWKASTASGAGKKTGAPSPAETPSSALRSSIEAGKQIGRFELRKLLGEGGFGQVWQAWDPQLNREVALKMPLAKRMGDAKATKRFFKEAQAAARLRHPHIVPVHDAGQDPETGAYYIAFEFVRGGTLDEELEQCRERNKPMALERAARIAREMAEALAYAHEQKIVHRDVKPQNTLIDEQGRAHIMDFGLAQINDAQATMTQDGAVLGTPAYMSPEQASGKSADDITPASDQYNLGMTFYEMLTGEIPFAGARREALPTLHLTQAPDSPRLKRKDLPLDLETICLKAIEKNPRDRYSSCEELADDLRRWQEDEPIQARRAGPVERLVRWARRNRVVAGLAAAVVLSLVVVATVGALGWASAIRAGQEEERRLGAELEKAEAEKQKAEAENARLEDKRKAEAETQRLEQEQERKLSELKLQEANRAREDVEERELLLRHQTYTADLRSAQQYWETGQLQAARQVLDKYQPRAGTPDMRSFEWHHLWQRSSGPKARDTFAVRNNKSPVTAIAFAPDGKTIVCACEDGTLQAWPRRGDPVPAIVQMKVPSGGGGVMKSPARVHAVAVAPDCRSVATAGEDCRVMHWDDKRLKYFGVEITPGAVRRLLYTEVAVDQPRNVRENLGRCLEEVSSLLKRSAAAESYSATGSFNGRLREASDLVSLLSSPPNGQESAQSYEPAPSPQPLSPEGARASLQAPAPSPLSLEGARDFDGLRVVLTCLAGPEAGKQFTFDERTSLILGREAGCFGGIPKDKSFSVVSLHHCLLDINPPAIRVRDLGSRNGTFVDGVLLDKRPKEMSRREGSQHTFQEADLSDNQELRLGRRGLVKYRVNVYAPPPPPTVQCAQCGKTTQATGPGAVLCEDCRRGPEKLAGRLQEQAKAGAPEAAAIRGYRLERLLGKGGQGAVWLAIQEKTGQAKALKLLLPEGAANPKAVKRFLLEMNNTRLLHHRNVVRLDDVGFCQGVFFLVMGYCDGGSVAGLINERGGPLPVDEAVEIALQALAGLEHGLTGLGPGKRLVHRDVKPANLFLAGKGSARIVKVGDYGLAKAFDESGLSASTRTGDIGGTPHFMARQQVLDFKRVTPDVDVWSLAASLYYMLTRQFPRDFTEGKDKWLTVLESDAVPIHKRNPKVPKRLAEVIDHALREKPSIGFTSAAEFKEALEDAL